MRQAAATAQRPTAEREEAAEAAKGAREAAEAAAMAAAAAPAPAAAAPPSTDPTQNLPPAPHAPHVTFQAPAAGAPAAGAPAVGAPAARAPAAGAPEALNLQQQNIGVHGGQQEEDMNSSSEEDDDNEDSSSSESEGEVSIFVSLLCTKVGEAAHLPTRWVPPQTMYSPNTQCFLSCTKSHFRTNPMINPMHTSSSLKVRGKETKTASNYWAWALA